MFNAKAENTANFFQSPLPIIFNSKFHFGKVENFDQILLEFSPRAGFIAKNFDTPWVQISTGNSISENLRISCGFCPDFTDRSHSDSGALDPPDRVTHSTRWITCTRGRAERLKFVL